MDKPIVIRLEKLSCGSKCCGTFTSAPVDDIDGKVSPSIIKRLFCCCFKPSKIET